MEANPWESLSETEMLIKYYYNRNSLGYQELHFCQEAIVEVNHTAAYTVGGDYFTLAYQQSDLLNSQRRMYERKINDEYTK